MEIRYEATGYVGRITLHNPPQNRLVTPAFADEAELAAFLARPDLRAIVVSGAARHFSAGADLAVLRRQTAEDPGGLAAALAAGKRLLEALSFSELPVVACIRGSCLGAGLEIALACHFRIAAATALLGLPEVERGLMPGLGGTLFSRDVVPRGRLMDLALSGRMILGDEAAALGLVDRAVALAELEAAADRFVEDLVGARSAAQVRSVMAAIHNASRMERAEALAEETRLFLALAAAGGG